MCDYCKDNGRLLIHGRSNYSIKGDFYPGIDIGIDPGDNTLFVESVADVYEPNFTEESIKINYCPMCGREL